MSTEDSFVGCILGLAIGDALGFPAEFRRREQILASFGENGLTDFVALDDPRWPARPLILGKRHPPGTFSDDTQMTLAVASALLAAGPRGLEPLMEEMSASFVAWSTSPDNDRAPGNACMTGCGRLASGAPWRTAGVADSKGCGSAMRVAPIGLYFRDDPGLLLEAARASSVLTHRHDAGIEGAAAAALLVALAVDRATPRAMYDAIVKECAPRSADFASCMGRLALLLDVEPAVALSSAGLGESWVAEEAVAAALYCFWRSPDDFARVVLTAANTDGDSDSIACIAGSIAGAYVGASGIPERWRKGVEQAAQLEQIGHRLYRAAEARVSLLRTRGT
jgi:ADP-ribosylglycohydrolase